MDSKVTFSPYTNYPDFEYDESDMSTQYFQIGAIKAFTNNEKIIPFGSFSLGATLYNVKKYADTWRFSITLGLGENSCFQNMWELWPADG